MSIASNDGIPFPRMETDPPGVAILVQQLAEQVQLLTAQVAGLAQPERVPPQTASGSAGQGMQSEPDRSGLPFFKPPKPPYYSGTNRDHAVISLWFARIEEYMLLTKIGPQWQVRFAATYLSGKAYQWYQYYLKDWIEQNGETTIVLWSIFKIALLKYFGEDNSELKYRNKWRSLTQRTSVAAYNAEFMQLRMVLNIDDKTALDAYTFGLKSRTKWEVAHRRPSTIEEAMQIADTTDVLIGNFSPKPFSKPFRSNKQLNGKIRPAYHPNRYESGAFEDDRGTPIEVDTLENKTPFSGKTSFTGKCFNCGIQGHRKADCRKPAKKSINSYTKNQKRQ